MALRIKNSSRLRYGELLKSGTTGIVYWDTLDLPVIPAQPDDILYTVIGTDTIDRLANRFYEDPEFWWVIAVANDMEILPTALNVGDEIRIPSPRYVRSNLFTDTKSKV